MLKCLQQVLVYQNFVVSLLTRCLISDLLSGNHRVTTFVLYSFCSPVVVCPSASHLTHTLINTHWHKTPDETSPHTFSHQSTHSSSWCVVLCSNEDVQSVQLSETQFLFEVCSTPSCRSLLRAQVPPELLLLLLLLQVERWL